MEFLTLYTAPHSTGAHSCACTATYSPYFHIKPYIFDFLVFIMYVVIVFVRLYRWRCDPIKAYGFTGGISISKARTVVCAHLDLHVYAG